MENTKRKVDIYSLYKKEKMVRIEDDEGNFIDVLLVKMTQGQRMAALEAYNKYLEEERVRLREREEKFKTLALAVDRYNMDDFINGLVTFEAAQRNEIIDLYPDLEGKTDEERKKIAEAAIEKFRILRQKELSKKTREELKQQFVDITIESQALLDAVRILNYQSLVGMCVDPETKESIFKSIADVEKIADRRVIDKLIESMIEFRALEVPKEVRRIASNDNSFLQAGASPESSTDSPTTTS